MRPAGDASSPPPPASSLASPSSVHTSDLTPTTRAGNGAPNCTVVRSLFDGCSAPVYNGCGEIYHATGLFLDSTFRNCRAQYAAGVFLLGAGHCSFLPRRKEDPPCVECLTNSPTVHANCALIPRTGGAPFPWCESEPWCARAILKMERCLLEGNVATGLGGGGGMAVMEGGEAEISDTVFRGNEAQVDEGGGLYFENAQAALRLRNTVFENNTAQRRGMALLRLLRLRLLRH